MLVSKKKKVIPPLIRGKASLLKMILMLFAHKIKWKQQIYGLQMTKKHLGFGKRQNARRIFVSERLKVDLCHFFRGRPSYEAKNSSKNFRPRRTQNTKKDVKRGGTHVISSETMANDVRSC